MPSAEGPEQSTEDAGGHLLEVEGLAGPSTRVPPA